MYESVREMHMFQSDAGAMALNARQIRRMLMTRDDYPKEITGPEFREIKRCT